MPLYASPDRGGEAPGSCVGCLVFVLLPVLAVTLTVLLFRDVHRLVVFGLRRPDDLREQVEALAQQRPEALNRWTAPAPPSEGVQQGERVTGVSEEGAEKQREEASPERE